MRALSIRQPHAEAIMRGVKMIEYRSRATRIRGRVYIYASLGRYSSVEEAEMLEEYGIDDVDIEDLPRGVGFQYVQGIHEQAKQAQRRKESCGPQGQAGILEADAYREGPSSAFFIRLEVEYLMEMELNPLVGPDGDAESWEA